MVAARVLSQILASDREKERMVPMKDLGYFDCGWLMLIMELGAMAAQLMGLHNRTKGHMGEEHHPTSLRLTSTGSGGVVAGKMAMIVAEVGIEHAEATTQPPPTEHVPIFLPDPAG
jgi:hypothetical protein